MSDRLDQLRKLHDLDPTDPFCTYGIALEHAKAQRLDEALDWLEKTLALDANYFYAYYQKGKILSESDRPSEARAVLESAIAQARKASGGEARHAADEMTTLLESIE